MEEYFKVRAINGQSTLNRAAYDRHQEALANRRAEGRYTLEEAALFIGDATGERAEELLRKLMDAAHSRALLVYEPGKTARYLYGDDFASRVREFYEEAYWCDLNEWLSDNEPRVLASFPDPNAAPRVSIERSGRASSGSPEVVPSGDTEQAETPTATNSEPDTTGLVAWQAVIIENWSKIAEAHGERPAARKVMKWLKDCGPRGVIPVEQPQRESLRWTDTSGNPQTVALKGVSNRLSEWRKDGIIPA